MELRTLQLFLEVADQKNFTRAGETLGYSQPTVSFQIRQLERELGVTLFDRIGHTVCLTEAGQDALAYAQQICALYADLTQNAAGPREISGTVRLGMADSLCTPLIATRFAQLRQQYPQLSLKIIPAGTDELFRLLDHNEVDLVCTLDSHIYDARYVIAAEERIGVHFIACADSPLGEMDAVSIRELIRLPVLLTEKAMSYRRLLDEYLARNSLVVEPVLETGRADLLCQLAAEGTGIAFLPDYVSEESCLSGATVRLKVPEFQVEVWKQILYRRDKWMSDSIRAVLEHLCAIRLTDG